MTHFAQRLHAAVRSRRTAALVGLDPRYPQLPPDVRALAERRGGSAPEIQALAFEEFCRRLIDVVAPLVPAVKPQAAFFEELGPPGVAALARVIRHARSAGLVAICDGKRGDIGSTAEAYARAYLAGEDPDAAPFGADALTVNPYLGRDSLDPFVKTACERGAGLYVLVRTSNPGAKDLQDRVCADAGPDAGPDAARSSPGAGGEPLYRHVARLVESLARETADAEGFGCVGAVVGATWPRELAELRAAMPHAPLLVPGYGAQGGGAADVAPALRADGLGALVNNSRGINFAWQQPPWKDRFPPDRWEQAAEAATRQMIADLASVT